MQHKWLCISKETLTALEIDYVQNFHVVQSTPQGIYSRTRRVWWAPFGSETIVLVHDFYSVHYLVRPSTSSHFSSAPLKRNSCLSMPKNLRSHPAFSTETLESRRASVQMTQICMLLEHSFEVAERSHFGQRNATHEGGPSSYLAFSRRVFLPCFHRSYSDLHRHAMSLETVLECGRIYSLCGYRQEYVAHSDHQHLNEQKEQKHHSFEIRDHWFVSTAGAN